MAKAKEGYNTPSCREVPEIALQSLWNFPGNFQEMKVCFSILMCRKTGPCPQDLSGETGLSDLQLPENAWGGQRTPCYSATPIWLSEHDEKIIQEHGVKIAHCPSANMKLASGFCKVPEMLEKGICIP